MPSGLSNLNHGQKIRTTTIERGVRILNGSGDDSNGDHHTSLNSVSSLMKQKRDQEKQALTQLNDRFAKYIDRVKFLENQNRKLLADLDALRRSWCDDSRLIRERYEPELLDARQSIDQITRDGAEAEIRAKRNEYDIQNLKRQYEEACHLTQADKNKVACLEQLLRDNEAELELLKSQMNDTETSINKYKNEIKRLNAECDRLLGELDHETLRRVRIENEKQTLEEQIPFMKAVHEQEMNELRALTTSAHIDPTVFYKHELERAVRDIRSDFEDLSDQHKREMEEWYKIKTEEIETQARREHLDSTSSGTKTESPASLRSALNDQMNDYKELMKQNSEYLTRFSRLEDELDQTRRNNSIKAAQYDRDIQDLSAKYNDLLCDYDELMNSKVSIEFEINAYRRLLESEETRTKKSSRQNSGDAAKRDNTISYDQNNNQIKISNGTRPSGFVNSMASRYQNLAKQNTSDLNSSNAELNATTTFQRQAKGPVSILEIDKDGQYIMLENTSRNKDVLMSGWSIKREIDYTKEINYAFPADLMLRKSSKLRIWAGDHGREDLASGEVENKDIKSWGVSRSYAVTTVLSDDSTEKATHIQKTLYTSN